MPPLYNGDRLDLSGYPEARTVVCGRVLCKPLRKKIGLTLLTPIVRNCSLSVQQQQQHQWWATPRALPEGRAHSNPTLTFSPPLSFPQTTTPSLTSPSPTYPHTNVKTHTRTFLSLNFSLSELNTPATSLHPARWLCNSCKTRTRVHAKNPLTQRLTHYC